MGWRRSARQRTAVDKYSDETPLPEPRRAAGGPSHSNQPYEGPDEAPSESDDDDDDADNGGGGGRSSKSPAPQQQRVERPPAEKGTARGIALDVDAFLEKYLGKMVADHFTKEAAIDALTFGKGARFSKYVGALEWRNAVVLWVNIGGSDYKNAFSASDDGGLTMSWYASPSYHEQSPVVERLIGSVTSKMPILLLCRLPGEPYVCCGRLKYVSHVPRRQPLKFTWQLADEPMMRERPDFKAIMEAG